MNLSNFKKHSDWVKVWSGKWSFHSCSQFGGEWTEENKVTNDSAFGRVVYVTREGISDCWVSESEKRDLGGRLVAQVKSSPSSVKEITNKLKRHAERVFSFIKKNQSVKIGLSEYNDFWREISDYYLWHLSVKYVVDYLSADDLKKYLPALEEARLYSEPVFRDEENFMEHIAGQIAENSGMPQELVLCTTKKELRAYFSGTPLPPRSLLKERHQIAIQFFESGKSKLFSDTKAEEMEKIVLSKSGQNLKGQIAYKGKAVGRVRIVWNPADPSLIFEKGDILVTGMTRPEFLLLMKKAAAFITDAGGILSHAAIVAREMKKPCVINTGIATKVLKDGDLVEVDADRGIITIINRA